MEASLKARFYVYLHRRDDGRIFYVGKGTGRRAFSKSRRNRYWANVSAKGYSVEIYRNNLSEECALSIEKILIYALRTNGKLTNLNDGGHGNSGWVPSEEFRKNLSAIRKGTNLHPNARSPEAMAKRKENMAGRTLSKTHKQKISERLKGKNKGGKIMDFYHPDHGFVRETAGVLKGKYGLDRNISSLVSGRIKSTKGWCLAENKENTGRPKGLCHHKSNASIFTFQNEEGEEFVGDIYAFADKVGSKSNFITRLIRGERGSHKGWRLIK